MYFTIPNFLFLSSTRLQTFRPYASIYYDVDVLNVQAIIRPAQTQHWAFIKIQVQHKSWEPYDIKLKFNILRLEWWGIKCFKLFVASRRVVVFRTILSCIHFIFTLLSGHLIKPLNRIYFSPCEIRAVDVHWLYLRRHIIL